MKKNQMQLNVGGDFMHSWKECGNKDRAMMVIAISLCSDKQSVYKITAGNNKFCHVSKKLSEKKNLFTVTSSFIISLFLTDSRWVALQASLWVLSAECVEVTEDTLELLTKPKAARRPAATRLEVNPGGRRPDWLAALGSRDRDAATWSWVAAADGAGALAAWWVNTSSVRR